jgi:Mrp family chromosome partitioning ATPase
MERIKAALERARQERAGSVPVGGAGARVAEPLRGATNLNPAAIRYTQTRVVEADPKVLARNCIVANRDRDPAADAFRMLRTRLLQVMRANGWTSIAVTSPMPQEGKSVTSVNLAMSLAREVNHTVLLADFDLRQPRVHDLLGLDIEMGIGDYLESDEPLSSILVNPGVDRLVVLPGRTGQHHASELMSAPRMRQLVDDITHRYPERIVLFDMPPVCVSDDVLAFSPLVDAFLLVVQDGQTDQPSLRHAAELLKNVNLAGTVLTMSEQATAVGY